MNPCTVCIRLLVNLEIGEVLRMEITYPFLMVIKDTIYEMVI